MWSRSILRHQRTLGPQREILLDLSFELNKDAVQFDFSTVGVVASFATEDTMRRFVLIIFISDR